MRRVWDIARRAGSTAVLDKGPLPSGKIAADLAGTVEAKDLKTRLDCFESLWTKQQAASQLLPRHTITITLPNGNTVSGLSHQTTPLDVAQSLSPTLAKSTLLAKVTLKSPSLDLISTPDSEESQARPDFLLWDLRRPLETDCQLQLLTWEDQEAKGVFWHSSAHVLGAGLEQLFGAYLCMGPALNPGFYYDAYMGKETLGPDQFPDIEKTIHSFVGRKLPFDRLVLTKSEALQLFAANPFKSQLISHKVPEGHKTTVYRCGPLIDLCKGPHIPHTGFIKAFALVKNSSCYWLGDPQNDSLQRIYGVSFPDKKELEGYIETQQKLAERDHHAIGRSQDLYFWHPNSAGSAFFLPAGARIYSKLMEFIRRQYRCRGYSEVLTPNMFSCDLWKTSGHYQKYKEDMFLLNVEGQEWGLKPMNCPAHCLMFDHSLHTYKELPIRFADFGVLHRHEASGALSGLTRVRRFQQDDAHIFCRKDQIMQEVLDNLDFLSYIYSVFGFEYELELSTRPKNALGNEALWRSAEAQLASALNQFGKPWKLNPGDGAFYGPKIDIKVSDALQRKHQCGTIQLDFNLPKRFNLQYKTESNAEHTEELTQYDDFEEKKTKVGFERPVIIHRAILGSIERVMAVLAEHFAGKWPFWLSPRQVAVLPVSEKFAEYAEKTRIALELAGFDAEADLSSLTLRKRIRNAQLSQFNYICVVGQEEVATHTVDVRDRDSNTSIGKYTLPAFISFLTSLSPPPSKPELRLQASVSSLSSPPVLNLQALDSQLQEAPYLGGQQPSSEDWRVYSSLLTAPDLSSFPHVARWLRSLKS